MGENYFGGVAKKTYILRIKAYQKLYCHEEAPEPVFGEINVSVARATIARFVRLYGELPDKPTEILKGDYDVEAGIRKAREAQAGD